MTPEDQLRRLRDVSRWHDVPLPGLPDDLDAPRPRRQRLVLVLAAAAVLLVIGLGALAGSWLSGDAPATSPRPSAPTSSASGVVPWAPIPPAPLPPVRTPSLPVACRAPDLSVRSGAGGGAGGTFYFVITVTNHGSECALIPSEVHLVDLSRTIPRLLGHLDTSDREGATPVLHPGAEVELRAGFPEGCLHRQSLEVAGSVGLQLGTRVFRLPGSRVPADYVSCGADFLELVTGPSDEKPLRYAALQARLSRPVRTADGLAFTVSLTNTSRRTITFDSCPTYTENVNVDRGRHEESYRLNCATARSIPAGATRRFAMRVKTPYGSAGQFKLGWSLREGATAVNLTRVR